MTTLVDRLWYRRGRPLAILWPLALAYRHIAHQRRDRALAYAARHPVAAPVIVVGNITAGGTGKSPLTAWLVRMLRRHGWRPVILTRGYGGKAADYPLRVTATTDSRASGDEPLMLAQQCNCPVVVDPDRNRAAQWALAQHLGDVLVCDDGLQHYRLPRDIEIAVFDGARGVGNGAPIPVGPMREPLSRLRSVDFVITNGQARAELAHGRSFLMTLQPTTLRHLGTGELQPVTRLAGQRVRAVAGIGNPGRFFDTLSALGARVRGRALPDHHRFAADDLLTEPDELLLMTAKDAVKCRAIAPVNTWVLEVEAVLDKSFEPGLLERLAELGYTR
ncbi:tetraacyldisaccharide 4'-kinase [Marinobacter sp. X15-166B]|uniref:tetraacyldisaccharide 4'-kinase n=1 Tax=Marinobacter sp. X15-166B TaxID=1897620 RepID=UPI00085C7C0E|nr:tetraacyldisaccharide 4'-kinase [Marinobacter sp. X15-166B]OEY67224.1 tetraacyldisaccharide 4'-kinase [Marinobacter sp. X15-166B]